MTNDTITPTPAEAAAIQTATRKLARANERLDQTLGLIRERQTDAEIFGEPAALDGLIERQAEDQTLVARLEAELDAATAAPSLRVEKDRRGAALKADATACDAEIASALATLEAALARGETIADQIVREFGDPALGYRALTGVFKASTLISRLRFWRQDVSKERLRAYRDLSRPQVSQTVLEGPTATLSYARPTLSRQERQARENAMQASLRVSPGAGVMASNG